VLQHGVVNSLSFALSKNKSSQGTSAEPAVVSNPIKPGTALLILGFALLGAYANSFQGPFIFDDASSILDNPSVRSFRTALFPPGNSGLTVSGRPVLNLSIAVNYALGKDSVVGYHLTNLGIHICATFLLFGVIRRTLLLPSIPASLRGNSSWLALAVAAIWALHPLQTESVTYVIQRAESLVGLFYLATIYLFIRSVEQPFRACWSWGAVITCLLGMGSKEVMASAPLVLLLLDRTFVSGTFRAAWQARRNTYIGLGVTWLFLAVCIVSTGNRGSTVGFQTDVTPWRYALTQCYAILHYLRLVFWPDLLVLDYGGSLAAGLGEVWGYVLGFVILGIAVAVALKRWPKVGFLGAVFFAILAPSSSVVPVATQTIAEHRMYLPLAAVVVGAVVALNYFFGKRAWVFFAIVALAFGAVTFHRNTDYRSELGIWKHTADNRPQNYRAWLSYGAVLVKLKMYMKAKEVYEQAIELNPTDRALKVQYAIALHRTGNTKAAIESLKQTLAEQNEKEFPEAYEAYTNLGVMLGSIEKREEAISYLTVAIKLKPEAEDARFALGNAFVAQGRLEEAAEQYTAALAGHPEAIQCRSNLGDALLKMGRIDEAIRILEKGVELHTTSPELLTTLGNALLSATRTAEARKRFEEALIIDPRYGPAHVKLGLLVSAQGDERSASAHYDAAIEAGGADALLLAVSAGSLLAQGRIEEALVRYRKASEAAPDDLEIRNTLANALLRSGQATEAAQIYEQLLSHNTEAPVLCVKLGMAYQQLGRRSDARIQFERALTLDPSNEIAKKSLLELEH